MIWTEELEELIESSKRVPQPTSDFFFIIHLKSSFQRKGINRTHVSVFNEHVSNYVSIYRISHTFVVSRWRTSRRRFSCTSIIWESIRCDCMTLLASVAHNNMYVIKYSTNCVGISTIYFCGFLITQRSWGFRVSTYMCVRLDK